MFCPNCGVHQTDGRRFCTSCGTNLLVISQALVGKAPSLEAPTLRAGAQEVFSGPKEEKRKKSFERGIKLTIIGGAFLSVQFFSFLLSLPFRNTGSPFGFFSFIALIMMAIGISKLVSARPLMRPAGPFDSIRPARAMPAIASAPQHAIEQPTPVTSSLEKVEQVQPGPSVIEAETEHLPEYAPRTGERRE